jgi:hypothetical protein
MAGLRRGVLVLTLAAFAGAPASANDSTAAFAAGGLVLTETDAIRMVEEDLYLSREEVRVRYVFRNETAADIEVPVAFPLPDIDISYYSEVPIEAPTDDPENFVGFTVSVDGKPVAPALHVSATLGETDVTAVLRGLGIPVSRFAPDLYERLWAIPRADQDALQAQELAFYERDYENVYPQWVQHAAFAWTQAFPAGRDVVVEHAYKPVVGSRFVSAFSLAGEEDQAFRDQFCLKDAAAADVGARLSALGDDNALLLADQVGYVLTTGANWAGTIERLSITIDAGNEGNLAVTCASGLAPTSATVLQGSYKDVEPDRDIWVLIVRRDPES